MEESTSILIGLAIYIGVILLIGLAAGRRVHDQKDYIVAGQNMGLGLCTFTLFATFFGGGTMMGVSGAAFSEGLLGVIADPFGAALSLFLSGFLYFRIVHRLRLLTIADFFRIRYGKTAEILAGLCMIPPYVGWVSTQFVAFGFILNALTGVDTTLAMIGSAAVVIGYTMAGGLWAVALTDLFQALVLIAGLGLLLPIVVFHAGGWNSVASALPDGHLSFTPTGGLAEWSWYVQSWLVIGLGGLPAQDIVQRAVAARDERISQYSAYISGTMYLALGMVPVGLGLVGATLLPEIENPEYIVPSLALQYLPPLGVAVVLGALVSAIMSSADSALLAPASVCGENLARMFYKDLSPRQVLTCTRWAVVVLGIIALAVGLYFKRIYDVMVGSWSVLLVSLLVPLLAGIYWKKANRTAALASIAVGLISWLALLLVQDRYPADLMAAGLALVTMMVVAPLTCSRDHPLPLKTLDGEPVAYADRLGILSPFNGKRRNADRPDA